MKTSSFDAFVTHAQNTACAIQSLSQVLYQKIDEHYLYDDLPLNCKEQMLGLADAIAMLARDINLEGAVV